MWQLVVMLEKAIWHLKVVLFWISMISGAWYCGGSEALPATHCHNHEWFSSPRRHVGPVESRIWEAATTRVTLYTTQPNFTQPSSTPPSCTQPSGSVVCWLGRPDSNTGWPNVGTIVSTLAQRYPNLHCFLWLVRMWRGLTIPATHTTEPAAHHRAAGLCAAQWGAARLCAITSTQVMVYHWWIPCETLVHTGSR